MTGWRKTPQEKGKVSWNADWRRSESVGYGAERNVASLQSWLLREVVS